MMDYTRILQSQKFVKIESYVFSDLVLKCCTSCVSLFTSLVLQLLSACSTTEQSTVKASLFAKYTAVCNLLPVWFIQRNDIFGGKLLESTSVSSQSQLFSVCVRIEAYRAHIYPIKDIEQKILHCENWVISQTQTVHQLLRNYQ